MRCSRASGLSRVKGLILGTLPTVDSMPVLGAMSNDYTSQLKARYAHAMSLHVIVLAAGKSRRMKSDLPKALVPLGGVPMLAHLLETARSLDPARLSVVVGTDAQPIKQAFSCSTDIHWTLQPEALGTGHAVLCALREHSLGRTLVVYVDGPLVSEGALRTLIDQDEPLAVLAATAEQPEGFGRLVLDSQGRLQRIVEEADASESEKRIKEVNSGIMAGDGALMKALLEGMQPPTAKREQYLTDLVALARKRDLEVGCVMASREDGALGANTLEELAGLERLHQQRQAGELMRQGARLADPARVDVRGRVHAQSGVFIDAGVLLEGENQFDEGVSIGPGVTIKDSVLGRDTRVEAHSVVEGLRSGANCRIGPFARIRPNTELGEAVHIGTFVEVKQARVGARTKANHQAYLGDVVIGDDCNIGAGAITCNYDGAEKHRTRIGDRVFVGSNVTLVAPVDIESDAYIAAGSTISKKASAGLTVARARQKHVSHWTPPSKRKP